MRSSSVDHLISHFVSLVVMNLSAGCSSKLDAAPAANPRPQPAASTPCMEVVHLVGVLTLKGPDIEAWWAVTDASGGVWRLEPSSAAQAGQFRQWQNSRISVEGVRVGAVLSTPRVRVERALLVR
jgi:hypothetical protein